MPRAEVNFLSCYSRIAVPLTNARGWALLPLSALVAHHGGGGGGGGGGRDRDRDHGDGYVRGAHPDRPMTRYGYDCGVRASASASVYGGGTRMVVKHGRTGNLISHGWSILIHVDRSEVEAAAHVHDEIDCDGRGRGYVRVHWQEPDRQWRAAPPSP